MVYLVCVSEPGGTLLLRADERDPLVTGAAESLPDVRVPVHAARLLGLLERVARGRTDAVREALVVPEGRVLEHEPTARLADAAPALTLVAVSSHPLWRVQVALKPELLLVRNHVRVGRIHVLGRWGLLLHMQRRIQVGRVRQVRVVPV